MLPVWTLSPSIVIIDELGLTNQLRILKIGTNHIRRGHRVDADVVA